MSGYYRMHRGWMENPTFMNERHTRAQAWCWLIERAAWKDCRVDIKGQTIVLKRGQLSYSTRFLAKAWQWPETVVRRFLIRLKSDAMIDTESSHTRLKTGAASGAGQTIITICNYGKYQCSQDEGGAASGAGAAQERRRSGANKKKGKKGKKEIKEIYAFDGKIIHLTEADFASWEKSYSYIDLRAELQAHDDYLAGIPPEEIGNWFQRTSNKLRNENARAARERRGKTNPGFNGPYERSQEDADYIAGLDPCRLDAGEEALLADIRRDQADG